MGTNKNVGFGPKLPVATGSYASMVLADLTGGKAVAWMNRFFPGDLREINLAISEGFAPGSRGWKQPILEECCERFLLWEAAQRVEPSRRVEPKAPRLDHPVRPKTVMVMGLLLRGPCPQWNAAEEGYLSSPAGASWVGTENVRRLDGGQTLVVADPALPARAVWAVEGLDWYRSVTYRYQPEKGWERGEVESFRS